MASSPASGRTPPCPYSQSLTDRRDQLASHPYHRSGTTKVTQCSSSAPFAMFPSGTLLPSSLHPNQISDTHTGTPRLPLHPTVLSVLLLPSAVPTPSPPHR